jgi:hypothetical protein
VSYAEGTSVPVEKSKAELEGMLARAGAGQYGVLNNAIEGFAIVAFTLGPKGRPDEARQFKIRLPLPRLVDFATKPAPGNRRDRTPVARTPDEQQKAHEQACRERWRALVLCVKAKLVLIDLGVSSYEREFLADLVLAEGGTVYGALAPKIADMYLSGRTPPLLGPVMDP